MKKKLSKILGVGLTLALLISLLAVAAPVSAVTTPTVTLTGPGTDAYVISKDNTYTILFTTGVAVPVGGDIVVGFPAGTNITGMATTDIEIDSTAGIDGIAIVNGAPSAVDVTGDYPAAQTLTMTVPAVGAGSIVQLTIDNVTNPSTTGTYNLTVATQDDSSTPVVIEAAVTSLPYTIKVPTIAGLPGVASVYNPAGILMAQQNDLKDAIDAAGPDYTIYVGPGTYAIENPDVLTINHEGLTLVSTDGAATTIIDGSALTSNPGIIAITINASDVTVDGFTLDSYTNDGIWIKQTTDGVTIKNNIFVDGGPGIVLQGENNDDVVTGATIADNVFEDNFTAIVMLAGAKDNTISGNTITGSTDPATAITIQGGNDVLFPTTGNTITGNTITGNAGSGIYIWAGGGGGGSYLVDNVIEGNTISGNTKNGIIIDTSLDGKFVTGLQILNNDITDNEGDGILIEDIFDGTTDGWDSSNVIKFNTITGNDTSTTDYGIQNDVTSAEQDVDATLNWWGTTVAADIAGMVKAGTGGSVTTAPFLTGTADTIFSASKVGTGTSLDAKTTVGVKVETDAITDTIIVAAKYTANPEEAIADAIAFYDVYVAGDLGADATATIKFYAGDALTEVYIWSADTETWGAVTPVSYSAYGGYVWVTIDDPAMLAGTPFALVGGEAEAGVLEAPTLIAPDGGANDVALMPTFAWTGIAGADSYEFQFADNANFVFPLVKLDGDQNEFGPLIVTAYAYVGELDYSTAYYWRVRAVSGDWTPPAGRNVGYFELASPWVSTVFITMGEAEEAAPPIVIEEAPDLPDIIIESPDIIIESPDVIVPLPAETPITPNWIYVIIAVGGVLVIALIVLIVRTRRVA